MLRNEMRPFRERREPRTNPFVHKSLKQLQNQAATKRGPPIIAQILSAVCILGGTGFVPSIFAKVLQLLLVVKGRFPWRNLGQSILEIGYQFGFVFRIVVAAQKTRVGFLTKTCP